MTNFDLNEVLGAEKRREQPGSQHAPRATPRSSSGRGNDDVQIVVGLDFGTSTSKVVIRAKGTETEEERVCLSFNNQTLIASDALIDDGDVLFGHRATQDTINSCARSFKTCISPTLGRANDLGAHILREHNIDPRALSLGMIAWLVKLSKKTIRERWGDPDDVTWNMGAPICASDWYEESMPYRQLIDYAVNNDVGVNDQGEANRVELQNDLDSALGQEHQGNNTFVFPEAHALLSAFMGIRAQQVDNGVYLLIDVGAGTTDMTWFEYDSHRNEQAAYFRGHSHPAGGDLFNTAIALGGGNGHGEGWVPIPGLNAGLNLAKLVTGIKYARELAMHGMRRYDPATNRHVALLNLNTLVQSPVPLVLVGGGAKIEEVKNAVQERIRRGEEFIQFQLTPLEPAGIVPGATDLHSIALGLSFHATEIPGFLDHANIVEYHPPEVVQPNRAHDFTEG